MGNIKQKLSNIVEAVIDLRDDFKEALQAKGVSDPGDNIAEYPEIIAALPSGGGASGAYGAFRVDWLDYDGSILKTEYVEYGEAATPPDTEALVVYGCDEETVVARFSGWGVPATVYGAVLCDMEIMAGYSVEMCAARVVAKAGDTVVLPFYATSDVAATPLVINWGEGEPETVSAAAQLQHTYAADFEGIVAVPDGCVIINIPNSNGVPSGNGVEGIFVHAGSAFTAKTLATLPDHGFEGTEFYVCDVSGTMAAPPRDSRFLCADSRTPWALVFPSNAANTFYVVDGPSVAGVKSVANYAKALSLPKVFGEYSSNTINVQAYMFYLSRVKFFYNEGIDSIQMGYNGAHDGSTLYLMATTVDCPCCKCLIAPNATTLKIVYNTRFYHVRVYAPACEAIEASTLSASGSYGLLSELTVKEGCTDTAVGKCVESYLMSPENVVAVFQTLPAGSATINVLDRTYDALSAEDKAVATDKGYTLSSVSYVS